MARRLTFNPVVRETTVEIDAKHMGTVAADMFDVHARKAWNLMMRSLADDAGDIMVGELPIGYRFRGVPKLVMTVEIDEIPDGYWIRPTKTVGGIPLGLLLETGTTGGTLILPVKGRYLMWTTPGGGKVFKLKVTRGDTPKNLYAARTIEKLGMIANIEARFWHFYDTTAVDKWSGFTLDLGDL